MSVESSLDFKPADANATTMQEPQNIAVARWTGATRYQVVRKQRSSLGGIARMPR